MGQLMGVGGAVNAKAAGGYTVGSRFMQLKTEPSAQDIESLFLFAAAWSLGATASSGGCFCTSAALREPTCRRSRCHTPNGSLCAGWGWCVAIAENRMELSAFLQASAADPRSLCSHPLKSFFTMKGWQEASTGLKVPLTDTHTYTLPHIPSDTPLPHHTNHTHTTHSRLVTLACWFLSPLHSPCPLVHASQVTLPWPDDGHIQDHVYNSRDGKWMRWDSLLPSADIPAGTQR